MLFLYFQTVNKEDKNCDPYEGKYREQALRDSGTNFLIGYNLDNFTSTVGRTVALSFKDAFRCFTSDSFNHVHKLALLQ